MDNINPYQAPPGFIDEAFGDPSPLDQHSIQYASRWLRLGGSTVDSLLVGPIVLAIVYWSGLFNPWDLDRETTFVEQFCLIVPGITVYLALNVILIYNRGQTIGKLACGTVVVNKDDFRQVSGNRYVFLRFLPMLLINNIPIIGDFIGLADVLAIFRSEKNCLHDDIAGTRVIMRDDLLRMEATALAVPYFQH